MYQEKKNRAVSIVVHACVAVVLAIIMIVLCLKNKNGEYYDLLINKALSKSINGNWAKTSFAFIFSIIAEYPAYFILPIFAVMLFYSDDLLPVKWRKVFKIAMAAISIIGWLILCVKSEVADKIEATGFDGIKFYLVMGILALCASMLGLYLGKYIPKKTRYTLFKFAIFAITYLLVALLVNQVLKTIWHRMRFRDMLKENALGRDGFSNFTPWYTPDMSRVELNESYHYSSFPSGHSNSAVHIFILCTLYKILPSWREKKWLKYVVYGGCTAFVLLTMISRICDDAHFLSDVIAGASISYIIYKVVEYLFFRNGNNFAVADKALAELE
ncbi:MAG: phosphatase PAP2 family protein [Clostridiales bacterium]|nr:phosphatase PAP2 family protein [Clostridiales bacterium]